MFEHIVLNAHAHALDVEIRDEMWKSIKIAFDRNERREKLEFCLFTFCWRETIHDEMSINDDKWP